MIAELLLAAAIATASPQSPSGGQRSTTALAASSVVLGEGVYDCTYSARNIAQNGFAENNKLTPRFIVNDFHKAHPFRCMVGWAGVAVGNYFVFKKSAQPWAWGIALGEGANIRLFLSKRR